eukprot:543959-Heterocapsa_arctica.AAC.1
MSVKHNIDNPCLAAAEHATFRRYVGKLMCTAQVRPDIAYCIKELARRVTSPTEEDMKAMKHLLKYIQSTRDEVLVLGTSKFGVENEVEILVDANWAEN